MKISELVEKLNKAKEEVGDLEVVTYNLSLDGFVPVEGISLDTDMFNDNREVIEILSEGVDNSFF